MLSTEMVSKNTLNKLSEEVFKLINMGRYSLYEISYESDKNVVYALRTGERKIFLLAKDGEAIEEGAQAEFSVKSRLMIKDVQVTTFSPNFHSGEKS
jgi:hypothetical protein